ncbi:MAG: hypothetical protein J5616_01555 [Bacteroidaceae bacterium]|nr:hypothetical protein [Bacteroidaceae bacterium]
MSSTNNQENLSSTDNQARGRATSAIAVISLVIVALACAAIWFLFFRGGSDADERTVYENIMRYENERNLDSLDVALNDYFDTYNSDAFHYSQLKDLHDRFFNERADWQAAESAMSMESIRHFMDVHPDGFYLTTARQKLDSLSFAHAVEADTYEAYEQYIAMFAQGKYVSEARKKMNELENVALTVEEKTAVTETLSAHFNALADNDQAAISATLASQINSYIGKTDPELEDIYAYMQNMHSSSRMIVFLVKNVMVTKVEAAGRNLFNVQFALDEETYSRGHSSHDNEKSDGTQEAPTPIEIKHFSGTAILNEAMKITSLVLRK